MGCDIHLFVEYRRKKTEHLWSNFGSEFNLHRNYMMFGLLADGVRMDFEEGVSIEQRGLPSDISYSVKEANRYYIDCEDEYKNCTLEQALGWQKNGCEIHYINGRPFTVDNPDYHSHSWLTINEYENQISLFRTKSPYKMEDYEAVLSAMKCLAKFGNDVRVVFWFDN